MTIPGYVKIKVPQVSSGWVVILPNLVIGPYPTHEAATRSIAETGVGNCSWRIAELYAPVAMPPTTRVYGAREEKA
jgi:hypothetical protein